jgi:hypothetical protein
MAREVGAGREGKLLPGLRYASHQIWLSCSIDEHGTEAHIEVSHSKAFPGQVLKDRGRVARNNGQGHGMLLIRMWGS